MLRNFEITILKEEDLLTVEDFTRDFAAIGYYYFQKLRKLKFPGFSYIKIKIINSSTESEIKVSITAKVLYAYLNFDLSKYLQLSKEKKLMLQHKLLVIILKQIFTKYDLDITNLSKTTKELEENNWQMQIRSLSKRVGNGYKFTLIMDLHIDSFIFFSEIKQKNLSNTTKLIASKPSYFILYHLFKKYKLVESKVILGGITQPVFEIDIPSNNVVVLKNATDLIKEWSV